MKDNKLKNLPLGTSDFAVLRYANEIYDNMLHDWKRIEKRALAERGQTRTEILWVKNAKGGEEPC